jgi:hypothetical protein
VTDIDEGLKALAKILDANAFDIPFACLYIAEGQQLNLVDTVHIDKGNT